MTSGGPARTRAPRWAVVLLLATAATLPLLLSHQIYWILLLNLAGIYVIVNSGLDIVYGYSGQISIGQAGFYAIGAYGSALLAARMDVPVILSIPLAALAAALCGALIAIPSVKLVHHFLAMVTIGFGEIVRLLLLNGGKLTGGPDGIVSIPKLEIGPLVFDTNRRYFYVILLSVAVLLAVKARLVDSRIGRAFVAIRESPRAAAACGIDVQRYKVLAFAIGAFYAGVGGAVRPPDPLREPRELLPRAVGRVPDHGPARRRRVAPGAHPGHPDRDVPVRVSPGLRPGPDGPLRSRDHRGALLHAARPRRGAARHRGLCAAPAGCAEWGEVASRCSSGCPR